MMIADESILEDQINGMPSGCPGKTVWERRVGKRVEYLSHCERPTRPYQKRNSDYWETMIKESRSKRLRVSGPIEEQVEANDLELLTAADIRQKLKDLGIITKLRNLKKLRKLLRESSLDKRMSQTIIRHKHDILVNIILVIVHV